MSTQKNPVNLSIRQATETDAKAIGDLSREFADYLIEIGDSVDLCFTPEIILRDGFGPNPAFSGLVAETEGETIGYLLYHPGYDTDYLTRTLHIIDLYVQSKWRHLGVGRRLIEGAAKLCQKMGGTQLFWSVSTRNENAISFYRRMGARFTRDLAFMRLDVPVK